MGRNARRLQIPGALDSALNLHLFLFLKHLRLDIQVIPAAQRCNLSTHGKWSLNNHCCLSNSELIFISGLIKSQTKMKHIFTADIDTSSAVCTLAGEDDRCNPLLLSFQNRRYDLRFRANHKALGAVITLAARIGAHTNRADLSQQAVKGAHGAEIRTPAAFCNKQIE